MLKSFRSWSKPDNKVDLIARKRVDWSTFQHNGSHIPLEFINDFSVANGGEYLQPGDSQEVILVWRGHEYPARLINTKRADSTVDNYEIKWTKLFKQILHQQLEGEYEYLQKRRGNNEVQQKGGSRLGQAYIEFYQTDMPFRYKVELIRMDSIKGFKLNLQSILDKYLNISSTVNFNTNNQVAQVFIHLKNKISNSIQFNDNLQVSWSMGKGKWAKVPWLAITDTRETTTTRRGIYCVYLFCEDMSGIYFTLMQGVSEVIETPGVGRQQARKELRERADQIRENLGEQLKYFGYKLDEKMNLKTSSNLGRDYEYGTIAHKYYPNEELPEDEELSNDLFTLLDAYTVLLDRQNSQHELKSNYIGKEQEGFTMDERVQDIIKRVRIQGYHFQPWEIAAYVTALKTKPFLILAGVSGTGKSKLPVLVAQATGSKSQIIPVRPDWTDSSDLLGYCDLEGEFKPGALLRLAQEASTNRQQYYVCVLDEMNLARVEHYFAEVLSQIENRCPALGGGFSTPPLVNASLLPGDQQWNEQGLPANLALVGTVNMDESTYGFSRKVLDRAFTLEFAEIDLTVWGLAQEIIDESKCWPPQLWFPRAANLTGLTNLDAQEKAEVDRVIRVLTEINQILVQAQLQVGYRVRDEIALFLLHAREMPTSFVTLNGEQVDPLDIALHMKILPRIIGGSYPIKNTVLGLLGWAIQGTYFAENEAEEWREKWIEIRRPNFMTEARYPRTAARLCLMWDRLRNEGFTTFWM